MKVLGTKLYDKGFQSAISEFIELVQSKPKNLLISPSDANVLVEAKTNTEFKKVVDDYYWNLPDGVPSVWILKLKGAKNANRCSGPDFFKQIMIKTAQLPINHFLCGGAEGVADKLAVSCKEWGNNNVIGTYSPPFGEMTEEQFKELSERINAKKSNIIWVGLGAPKQLYFSHKLRAYVKVQAILPVGAAFDFHTGRVKKAPAWMQRIGMEWFYRLLREPGRLFKRYAKAVPAFVFYNLLELFSFKFFRN